MEGSGYEYESVCDNEIHFVCSEMVRHSHGGYGGLVADGEFPNN